MFTSMYNTLVSFTPLSLIHGRQQVAVFFSKFVLNFEICVIRFDLASRIVPTLLIQITSQFWQPLQHL